MGGLIWVGSYTDEHFISKILPFSFLGKKIRQSDRVNMMEWQSIRFVVGGSEVKNQSGYFPGSGLGDALFP